MTALFFSIVVPTRARLARLRVCLDALANSEYPKDQFEVIVVNDGSEALSTADLAQFHGRLDVVAVEQAWAGPAAARNNGAMRARGNYVAFTDDDCAVARDWLRVLEATIRAHPAALIGGRTVNALPRNIYATASQMLVDYLYGYYHGGAGRGPRFFTSNNLCVSSAGLRDLGGFDVSFKLAAGEDRDFCDRWLDAGRPLQYAPDAIVHHRNALTLRSFTRQHLNYGRGARSFHLARARRAKSRVETEPWSFYARLVAFPLANGWKLRALLLSALLAWSQVVNVAGYFLERARPRS